MSGSRFLRCSVTPTDVEARRVQEFPSIMRIGLDNSNRAVEDTGKTLRSWSAFRCWYRDERSWKRQLILAILPRNFGYGIGCGNETIDVGGQGQQILVSRRFVANTRYLCYK